jgi:hypothetical protein
MKGSLFLFFFEALVPTLEALVDLVLFMMSGMNKIEYNYDMK